MLRKLTFCTAASIGLGLMTSVAMAADGAADSTAAPAVNDSTLLSQISLGMQWMGGTNAGEYGRYNGFTRDGVDFLLGFSVEQRAPWDSGDTSYFEVSGSNLDFQTGNELAKGFRDTDYTDTTSNQLGPMAELHLSFGEQGSWGINLGYRAISYTGNIIDSLYTVEAATGTLNGGLLPYGGASNNPLSPGSVTSFTAPALSAYMLPFQVGTRRDVVEVSGHFIMDDWTFKTDIQHEHKIGSLEESMRGTYGGMAFALPVNYDTDRFNFSAAYVDPDFQALIEYTYSRFADNNMGVTLPYPVYKSLSASNGPYAQSAFYSTPPSNSAHYVTFMLADKLAPQTRLVVNGRFGVELQDSTFAPNSADPDLSSTLGNPTYHWFDNLNSMNQGTSAFSPDATAWIYQANARLNTNLAKDLDASVSYSLDGRNVSINQYQVWIGGSSPDATANTAVYVVPQNWFKQTAKVEMNYRIMPATKLTVGYAFNNTNRTNAQVEHSITNTFTVELNTMLTSNIMGRVSYQHGNRSGTLVYGRAWGNLENGAPEEFGTPSGAYYQAPLVSDAVTLRVDYAPIDDFSGGLFLKYANDSYHYPAIPSGAPSGDTNLLGHGEGITRDYNLTVGPDLSYRPSEDVNLHVYYTFEQIFFDNRGNGACAASTTGNCAGSAGYYQNKYTSNMHTAGISGDWQVDSKLKLSAEYNLSSGSVIFGQYNGVMVSAITQSYQNVVSYPDINSTMHDLRLSAIYQFTDNIDGSLIYRYSMFHNDDWNDFAAPVQPSTNTGTSISILTPGYGPPHYNISTIGVVFRVRL